MNARPALICTAAFAWLLLASPWELLAQETPVIPAIDGEWWSVADNPDLGECTTPNQEPVDFGVWQAADGTWQLWSCIRNTSCGDHTRLFHGWEGKSLTDTDWKPLGIVMRADTELGESSGGLQAPHVIKKDGTYYMFYGDWNNICLATSEDGKSFTRVIRDNGKTGMFNEGVNEFARDAMVIPIGNLYYCYYTAHTMRSPEKNHRGVNYCRMSSDLENWSMSRIVEEGNQYFDGPYSCECPHIVFHEPTASFFLFNTQRYKGNVHSTIYRSGDPLHFGINDPGKEATTLSVAAPEIIRHEGQDYIAALKPELDGIRIAKLKWVPEEE